MGFASKPHQRTARAAPKGPTQGLEECALGQQAKALAEKCHCQEGFLPPFSTLVVQIRVCLKPAPTARLRSPSLLIAFFWFLHKSQTCASPSLSSHWSLPFRSPTARPWIPRLWRMSSSDCGESRRPRRRHGDCWAPGPRFVFFPLLLVYNIIYISMYVYIYIYD